MFSAILRKLRQLTQKGRAFNEINDQLEKFGKGDGNINDIEGAIVLIKTRAPGSSSYLHKALAAGKVFALCQADNPESYVSILSPGGFRVYVVFTAREHAEPNLKDSVGGVLVEQPFYRVVDAAPVSLGIIINPLNPAIRLDIDPPEMGPLIKRMVEEAKVMQARHRASQN